MAKWSDNTDYVLSYNESWGNVLGRRLGYRCKICPDGIGICSDISIGDSWNTKDGYPDFTESDGKSFVMLRTLIGKDIFNNADKLGYLDVLDLKLEKIKEMQPYQYERRKIVGWRILALQLMSGFFLNIKGLGLFNAMMKSNIKNGYFELKGSARRFYKREF